MHVCLCVFVHACEHVCVCVCLCLCQCVCICHSHDRKVFPITKDT